MPNALTVFEFLAGLLPGLRTDSPFPWWPPDCFALCLRLLKHTGAYTQLLQDWPPDRGHDDALSRWTSSVRGLGDAWRTALRKGEGPSFNGLDEEWELVRRSFPRQLWTIGQDRVLQLALMKLVAAADEASEGVGVPEDTGEDDPFLQSTRVSLRDRATLGRQIDPSRITVLPRMHTPQSGLTERSLSAYLSMCDAHEVTTRWLFTPFLQRDSLNLLLIPWPLEILVKQFREMTDTATELPRDFGFFTYDYVQDDEKLIALVESLYEEANRQLGRIDGVILPELAITDKQFQTIRDKLPQDCFLIAGVGHSGMDQQRGENQVRLSFPMLAEVVQRKHLTPGRSISPKSFNTALEAGSRRSGTGGSIRTSPIDVSTSSPSVKIWSSARSSARIWRDPIQWRTSYAPSGQTW